MPEQVREDLERQVEDFSARVRLLELDLRAARDEMRGLKEETEEAQKKASALEIAKVKSVSGRVLLIVVFLLLKCSPR